MDEKKQDTGWDEIVKASREIKFKACAIMDSAYNLEDHLLGVPPQTPIDDGVTVYQESFIGEITSIQKDTDAYLDKVAASLMRIQSGKL